jgi:hypothetical protein
MLQQFEHSQGEKLLSEIGEVFKSNGIFQRKDHLVVFVCGAVVGTAMNTMRSQFLIWAKGGLPNVIVLLAENAYQDTLSQNPPEAHNLSEFEKLIGEISDCVLIFPESPGSFAEMGVFSQIPSIRRKTLVVNDYRYQATDSFASLGPISTIDRYSFLRPAIYINNPPGSTIDFSPVRDRLSRVRSSRKRFHYRPYKELDYGEKFLAVLEMIRILRAVTFDGLRQSIKVAFESANKKELGRLLSILVAAGYVERRGEYFVPHDAVSLLEFKGVRIEDFTARALYYYKEYHTETYEVARR